MLKATDKETGEFVIASEIDLSSERWTKSQFICPITEKELVFVRPHQRKIRDDQTTDVSAYFRHKLEFAEVPKQYAFDPDIFQMRDGKMVIKNESIEHITGKKAVADYCKHEIYGPEANVSIQFEYVVKLVTGKWRIADVAVVWPNGIIDVHEVQLSAISTEMLETRSNDYLSEGINCYWYFGKDANNDANKGWYAERTGWEPNTLLYSPKRNRDS